MKLLGDSVLDLTPELKERLGITLVPLTIELKENTYLDDDNLDLTQLMDDIAKCEEKVLTAAPSPDLFRKAFEGVKDDMFCVVLSDKLSATYQNATIAKNEDESSKRMHIFNTKSASAGEVLVALKIRDLINSGESFENIIREIEELISRLETYLVVDDISTLKKNGRISHAKGVIVNVLGIKPILCINRDGHLISAGTSRNDKQSVKKMMEAIEQSGKDTSTGRLVISHCLNLGLAEKIRDAAQEQFNFSEILVIPTGGVASVYCNAGGIIMAF